MTSDNPSYERPADPFWRPLIKLIFLILVAVYIVALISFSVLLIIALSGQMNSNPTNTISLSQSAGESLRSYWMGAGLVLNLALFVWNFKDYRKAFKPTIKKLRLGHAARAVRLDNRSARRYTDKGLKLNDSLADAQHNKEKHAALEDGKNQHHRDLVARYTNLRNETE